MNKKLPTDDYDLHIVVSPAEFTPRKGRIGLVIVSAFVVVAVGSYFLINNHFVGTSQIASIDIKASAQATIHITAQGFSPSAIQIRPGTQVTWINDDSMARQVAANPFPKNNSIPDFDSSILLQSGDTYSYVFSKAGTYTYHDESRPFSASGSVVVK